jgi:hypothetical protein
MIDARVLHLFRHGMDDRGPLDTVEISAALRLDEGEAARRLAHALMHEEARRARFFRRRKRGQGRTVGQADRDRYAVVVLGRAFVDKVNDGSVLSPDSLDRIVGRSAT